MGHKCRRHGFKQSIMEEITWPVERLRYSRCWRGQANQRKSPMDSLFQNALRCRFRKSPDSEERPPKWLKKSYRCPFSFDSFYSLGPSRKRFLGRDIIVLIDDTTESKSSQNRFAGMVRKRKGHFQTVSSPCPPQFFSWTLAVPPSRLGAPGFRPGSQGISAGSIGRDISLAEGKDLLIRRRGRGVSSASSRRNHCS